MPLNEGGLHRRGKTLGSSISQHGWANRPGEPRHGGDASPYPGTCTNRTLTLPAQPSDA
jgi:hypothetical protein